MRAYGRTESDVKKEGLATCEPKLLARPLALSLSIHGSETETARLLCCPFSLSPSEALCLALLSVELNLVGLT